VNGSLIYMKQLKCSKLNKVSRSKVCKPVMCNMQKTWGEAWLCNFIGGVGGRGSRYKLLRSRDVKGCPGPDYVVCVFVCLRSVTVCRLYKLTLSEQTQVARQLRVILVILMLIPLALQSFVDFSLFQNFLSLFSVLLRTSPVPHGHVLQISLNWLRPPQLKFSYTSSAV